MGCFKNTYFQNVDNCFAWCWIPEDSVVGVFSLFKPVVFTTEFTQAIRYPCYAWKLWPLHSRFVNFPLLKRTRKKIVKEPSHNLVGNKAETTSSFWRWNSSLLWQPEAWLQRQLHGHRSSSVYPEPWARVKQLSDHPRVSQASLLESQQPFPGTLQAPQELLEM